MKQTQSTQFLCDITQYKLLVQDFFTKSNALEKQGGNILHIQSAWNGNLATKRMNSYPIGYETVGEALDNTLSESERIAVLYGKVGCNAVVRVNHSVMKEQCTCLVCSSI